MADVNEVLRLMRHAADLLEEQTEPVAAVFGIAMVAGSSDRYQLAQDQGGWAAASGLAQATLRMVAAFMVETPAQDKTGEGE